MSRYDTKKRFKKKKKTKLTEREYSIDHKLHALCKQSKAKAKKKKHLLAKAKEFKAAINH